MHPNVELLYTLPARILGSDPECPVPTHVSRFMIFCIQARHLQIFLLRLSCWILGRRSTLPARQATLRVPGRGVATYPFSDKQPFRRDSGREGLGTTGPRFLYMTGVSIPLGSSPHGVSRNWPITFLSLREPRRRHRLVRSARGLSPTTVRTCMAPRKTMCPSASSSLNTTTVVVDALPDLAIHRLELPEAQAASRSLHMQQPVSSPPIWAASLDMVTRSSHSADAKPARPSRFDAGA